MNTQKWLQELQVGKPVFLIQARQVSYVSEIADGFFRLAGFKFEIDIKTGFFMGVASRAICEVRDPSYDELISYNREMMAAHISYIVKKRGVDEIPFGILQKMYALVQESQEKPISMGATVSLDGRGTS